MYYLAGLLFLCAAACSAGHADHVRELEPGVYSWQGAEVRRLDGACADQMRDTVWTMFQDVRERDKEAVGPEDVEALRRAGAVEVVFEKKRDAELPHMGVRVPGVKRVLVSLDDGEVLYGDPEYGEFCRVLGEGGVVTPDCR